MKNILQYTFVAAVILGLGASQARAGDDEAIAAIGGFVAGIITGAVLDDDHDHYRVERYGGHHDSYYKDRNYRSRRDRYDYRTSHGPSGHWEIRRVKVWVPGHWEFTYNRCGDRIRIWKSGYHVWQKNRVWVPHRGKGSHGRYCD